MRILYVLLMLTFICACSNKVEHENLKELEIELKKKQSVIDSLQRFNQINNNSINIDMSKNEEPKVTGIGGIFFKSNNPKETMNWYGENLGLAITPYGSPFEFRNAHKPDEVNYLNWSAFPENTDYFEPSKKEFMINYRVQNLDKLIEKLKANGVTICDEIDTYEYGRFIHILDPEGNKIELWEPIDSELTKLGGPTTK